MILNCPSCGTRFLIDPALLEPDGRKVRCGRCGHSWFQDRPAPSEAVAAVAEAPSGSAIPRLQAFDEARRSASEGRRAALPGPAPSRGLSRIAAGWIALVALLAALIAGALFERERIIALVPEAAELYQMAGLQPAPAPAMVGQGLELRDVTSVKRLVDGQQTLLIEGAIVNASDQLQPVPQLRASVTDAGGGELTHWFFSANSKELEPGGSTTFQTSTESPSGGVNLSLIFVAEGAAQAQQ
jgi:predicted Zn finger-like uncharacterized protein